jgi:hypothetical protein
MVANNYIDKYNQSIGKLGSDLGFIPQGTQPPNSSMTSTNNTATNYSANNDYAVGSRTYNGSSNSPHAGSGGIDTSGYATRDNENETRRRMLLQLANKPNGQN